MSRMFVIQVAFPSDLKQSGMLLADGRRAIVDATPRSAVFAQGASRFDETSTNRKRVGFSAIHPLACAF